MEAIGNWLMETGPAETTGYMLAGYAVIFGMMALYLASMAMRWRKMKREIRRLEER